MEPQPTPPPDTRLIYQSPVFPIPLSVEEFHQHEGLVEQELKNMKAAVRAYIDAQNHAKSTARAR